MNYFPLPPNTDNHYLTEHAELMAHSFQSLLGYPLLNSDNLAQDLFYAPFVLLSHNTKPDPIFNYANQQGLELFELTWQELIVLPSRASAETMNQAEREHIMNQVRQHGFTTGYKGIRISKTGKRFEILNAIIWNLIDKNGNYQGQAACLKEWRFL